MGKSKERRETKERGGDEGEKRKVSKREDKNGFLCTCKYEVEAS